MALNVSAADQALLQGGAQEADPEANLAAPVAAPVGDDTVTSSASLFKEHDPREDDLGEAAAVGGYQLVNQLAMGVPQLVLDHTLSADDRKLWDEARERHPYANYGAGAVGFGASMLLGGPLFKAAATAGKAAHAAVLGTEAVADVARAGEVAATAADLGHFAEPGEAAAHAAVAHSVSEEAMPKALAALTEEHGSGIGSAAEAAKDAVTEHIADKLAPIASDPGAIAAALGKAPAADVIDMTGIAVAAAKAASPSLSKQALAKVAQYAVEGAVLSAPQTLTNAALGDWQGAGEALAWGAGGNVALGGLTDLISTGAKAGLEKLGTVPFRDAAEDLSRRQTLRAVGVPKGAAKKLGEDKLNAMVDWVHDSGIMGQAQTKEQLPELIEAAYNETGKKIGSALDALDAANAEQGGIHQIDPESLKTKLADKLKDAAQDKFGIKGAESAEAQKLIDVVNGLPENPTLRDIQELKSALGDKARFDQTATKGVNEVRQDAYHAVKEFQEEQADAIAKETNNADVVDQWKQAKRDFGAASTAMKGVEEFRAQQSGNRIMGLTDNIAAQGSMLGIIGSLVSGHPLGAAASVAGYMGKKLIEDRGVVLGSRVLRALARAPDDGAFGLQLAQKAKQAWQERIDTLPEALKNAGSLRQRTIAGGPPRQMSQQKFDDTKSSLEAMVPTGATSQHAEFASNLLKKGAPNVAQAYQQQMVKAVTWLHSQLPQPPPKGPVASYPWQPTANQLRAFGEKESVIQNPLSVVDHIKDNTLTSNHVLALMQFPSTYQAVVAKSLEAFQSKPPSSLQRGTLSTLLQKPIDQAQGMIGDIAKVASGPPLAGTQASEGTPNPAGQGKQPKSFKLQDGPTEATDSQRALSNTKG